MKKVLSIILALSLMFGLLILPANAESNKLDERLKERLEAAEPDEVLDLTIWYAYPGCPEPDFQPEDYGEDAASVNAYIHDYRAYKRDYYSGHNAELTDKVQALIDAEIIYIAQYTPVAQLKVKAADVETLAELEDVGEIFLLEPFTPEPETQSGIYESRYLEQLKTPDGNRTYSYRELYYHKDENGETDWALIEANAGTQPDMLVSAVVFGRVLTHTLSAVCFQFNYGIYDVIQDKFIDLVDIKDTPELYPGLYETVWNLKIGRPLGDADKDNDLTILDATTIQRYLAELETNEIESDIYWLGWDNPGYHLFSDYDRDDDITILDATAIRRALVGLDATQAE